jgi:N-acetylglutamate synthase-like GNAT family acetyltransferase
VWPDVPFTCTDNRWSWPGVARYLSALAPHLACRYLVSVANVRTTGRSVEPSQRVVGEPLNRAVGCDNRRVQVVVRRARPDDQPVITAMVRRARLNPAGLHWEQFVVGERDGRAVGVAQLRRHSDGTKELASLAVEPGAREHGVATQMVDALLAGETAAVYALIDRRFVGHFARWGFRQVGRSELPRSVSRIYLIGRAVTTLGSLLRRQRIRIVPLLRPAR